MYHICYKIEFKPTNNQINIISNTLGTCRFLYNKYLSLNMRVYKDYKEFVSGYDFAKTITEALRSGKYDHLKWIINSSSKARKQSIMEAERAYKRFFKGNSRFPRFKKKNDNQSYYFIKDQVKIESKRLRVPVLGWLKLKEFDFISKDSIVKSGRIIKDVDKYYVMLIVECEEEYSDETIDIGLGIDVGIKNYMTISLSNVKNHTFVIENINKSKKVKDIENKIKQYQKIISNKIEMNKINHMFNKNNNENREGRSAIYYSKNILKLRHKVKILYQRLRFIRMDYIKKICNKLTKTKVAYITIENLTNKKILQKSYSKLAEQWAKCNFYYFRTFLQWKCFERGIELRIADKHYPSSKTCSCCGHVKKKLLLKDRTYVCKKCGLVIDRDSNAAINLLYTNNYKVV